MKIELKILDILKNNPAIDEDYLTNGPKYAHEGDAGLDLRACIDKPMQLYPNECKIVNTGISAWIGSCCDSDEEDITIAGIIVPRSGLGVKHGILLGNSIGVIDEGYTGEILISVWNRSEKPYTIQPGDKICQMMFMPVFRPQFEIVDEFSEDTARGVGGFGSTG